MSSMHIIIIMCLSALIIYLFNFIIIYQLSNLIRESHSSTVLPNVFGVVTGILFTYISCLLYYMPHGYNL